MLCLLPVNQRSCAGVRSMTYAMILTLLPPAFFSISMLNFEALCSIDAEAGTDAVMTSIPLALSASVIPRQ